MNEQNSGDGFTEGDKEFLSDIGDKIDQQEVAEKNFWGMWEELVPEAKESVVDMARKWVEDGETGLPNSDLNIEFYKRLVEQWDKGELDKE